MKCDDALDTVYESEETIPFGKRLGLAFHILFCGSCASNLETYEKIRSLLRRDFFPPSPDFCDTIMDSIYHSTFDEVNDEPVFETYGFSVRSWIIVGIIMLLSLTSIFFGQDFVNIAQDQGSSFLLPLGIIIGIVITGYGALFIGSHLKEFSERFKL
ncbi:MAG: peptidoglycan-binding protein [Treponema sp.]|jgi:hypothetical protein|nr:peptidoglycan-binding protein [Treponema sp.]